MVIPHSKFQSYSTLIMDYNLKNQILRKSQDLKLAYYNSTVTSMFIAVQFIIARFWNQPRCPSTDEWIKKLWCIYTQWNTIQS